MRINAENLGKRFRRNWVFRNLDLNISSGAHIQILGGNGSGKSTLLSVISGFSTSTEGTIKHFIDDEAIVMSPEHINMAAPYTQLFEQLT
ncbi:MAG: ATP-binding cassette domain-containing protein, partial [Flavobacteriales bacterium]|nr:ATP-binding cassette domain-containing protein [Flavobacteriales bacterium]